MQQPVQDVCMHARLNSQEQVTGLTKKGEVDLCEVGV